MLRKLFSGATLIHTGLACGEQMQNSDKRGDKCQIHVLIGSV